MEKPNNPEGFMQRFGREAKKIARAAGFAAAFSAGTPACEGPQCKSDAEVEEINKLKEVAKTEAVEEKVGKEIFDDNPEYFEHFSGGEFTKEEREARTEIMPGGEKIFHDVGLDFYYVQKGDTISGIREALSQYEKYAYLKTQTNKLESFNIPAKKLKAGMWLPIPWENDARELTEEQLAHYASLGIEDIMKNPDYHDEIEDILQKVSKEELLATVIAIAKQESGNKPIGQFTWHRWEDHQKAFSFSLFHVLMKGPGLTARHKLELTEGQTYHPENSTKLLLAFLIEKAAETKKQPDIYFPIDQHLDDFAVFYNGRFWKKTNPDYTDNIMRYYAQALDMLQK